METSGSRGPPMVTGDTSKLPAPLSGGPDYVSVQASEASRNDTNASRGSSGSAPALMRAGGRRVANVGYVRRAVVLKSDNQAGGSIRDTGLNLVGFGRICRAFVGYEFREGRSKILLLQCRPVGRV